MAQPPIEHSCGHTENVHLFGKSHDRQNRREWLEAFGLCSNCFAVRNQDRREKANSEAARWAAEHGLPVMQGSEKQCAWAETIRQKELSDLVRAVRRAINDWHASEESIKLPADFLPLEKSITGSPKNWNAYGILGDCLEESGHSWAAYYHAAQWLAQQDQAKWWIDNRYKSGETLIRERAEEPAKLEREQRERQQKAEAERAELEAKKESARREAETAIKAKAELEERQRGWLTRLGELIGHEPADLVILRFKSNYGWRVIINDGGDPYARKHLVDYYPKEGTIKTCKELVAKKAELTIFCVDFWALNPEKNTQYIGKTLLAKEGQ